jgi:hypothetical protein
MLDHPNYDFSNKCYGYYVFLISSFNCNNILIYSYVKMAVFWVVAPCSLVEVYQRFRGPCCLKCILLLWIQSMPMGLILVLTIVQQNIPDDDLGSKNILDAITFCWRPYNPYIRKQEHNMMHTIKTI